MVHDLHQLPRDALPALRQSLLELLLKYSNGPKPVRTQLTVSLAHLAIQMTEWKDVLPILISTFSGKGDGATSCFLEFLKVLAEELTEARKINLSVRSDSTSVSCWHPTTKSGNLVHNLIISVR
jgi:transportin-3